MTRIDTDEDGPVGLDGYRRFEREVAAGLSHRPPAHAPGKPLSSSSSGFESCPRRAQQGNEADLHHDLNFELRPRRDHRDQEPEVFCDLLPKSSKRESYVVVESKKRSYSGGPELVAQYG